MNMKGDFRRTAVGARWLAVVVAGLALSACSLPEAVPDLTRFYVLTPTLAAVEESAPGDAAVPSLAIRSVVVPEFLRGKVMQVRLAQNEVRFVDLARWAEPLEAGLQRVLRENFARRTGAVRVVARGGEAHDYEVAIHVRHCEGVMPAGVARLAARVEIHSAGLEAKLVAEEEFTTDVPGWDGKDYGELAGKLSEAAGALSERILALLAERRG